MENAIIPHSYQAWYHCITVDCGIKLTPEYVQQRINSLEDDNDFRTQQFISLYGMQHTQKVLGWFQQAQKSL